MNMITRPSELILKGRGKFCMASFLNVSPITRR